MKKEPKFYCDNCGSEVPLDARNCPGCGRFFTSVLCPSCQFSGEEDQFKKGCPLCGYSMRRGKNKSKQKQNKPTESLPFWVYILAAAAVTGGLAALFLHLV